MAAVASLFLNLTVVAGGKRILGEATDAEYKHQIVVDGWNWALNRSKKEATPASTNSVEPSILTFEKAMCRGTAGMLAAMRGGDLLTAVFSLEEDSDIDFLLKVTLEKARLINYDLGMVGPAPEETWQLNYSDIKFDYGYKDKGRTSVVLHRPDNASKTLPADGSAEGKLEALAKTIEPDKLGPLLKRMQSELASSSLRPAATAKPTSVTKPTGPGKKF